MHNVVPNIIKTRILFLKRKIFWNHNGWSHNWILEGFYKLLDLCCETLEIVIKDCFK